MEIVLRFGEYGIKGSWRFASGIITVSKDLENLMNLLLLSFMRFNRKTLRFLLFTINFLKGKAADFVS